jgi:hypothetical protein
MERLAEEVNWAAQNACVIFLYAILLKDFSL